VKDIEGSICVILGGTILRKITRNLRIAIFWAGI
jgi:hypothetical protein